MRVTDSIKQWLELSQTDEDEEVVRGLLVGKWVV